jgi:glycosyltransferase involved in cell wall biosynthesis
MRKLSILIPSYKRPEVLSATLNGLLENTPQRGDFDVNISVGLNKASQEDTYVVNNYTLLFAEKGITFNSVFYEHNMGKATVLNVLLKLYAHSPGLVITLDNDMVITKPWLHLVGICDAVDYDIIGFSGTRFWAHDPIRERCMSFNQGDYKFYLPYSVAGGMMLFHHQFLKDNPWTNHGGVYGRDDATMCLLTKKKYVLHTDEDWLEHDPLNSSTPQLKSYEDKKKELYQNGTTVFPVGWDEV